MTTIHDNTQDETTKQTNKTEQANTQKHTKQQNITTEQKRQTKDNTIAHKDNKEKTTTY